MSVVKRTPGWVTRHLGTLLWALVLIVAALLIRENTGTPERVVTGVTTLITTPPVDFGAISDQILAYETILELSLFLLLLPMTLLALVATGWIKSAAIKNFCLDPLRRLAKPFFTRTEGDSTQETPTRT